MLGTNVLVCDVLLLKGEISNFLEGDSRAKRQKLGHKPARHTHVMALGLQTDQDGGRQLSILGRVGKGN